MAASATASSRPLKGKYRHYVAWPFAFLLALFAHSTDTGFKIGIPIILVGELIRIWAGGHLLKSRQLATDGPYAFVRHPLYVGNFILGLGFCMIIWNPWLVAVYAIGFAAFYMMTIRLEEAKLKERFEPSFESYVKHVRRFVPRLTPYPLRARDPFRWKQVLEHGEQITIFAIAALIIAIYLRQQLYQEKQSVEMVMPTIAALLVVSTVLAVLQFYRRLTKNKS